MGKRKPKIIFNKKKSEQKKAIRIPLRNPLKFLKTKRNIREGRNIRSLMEDRKAEFLLERFPQFFTFFRKRGKYAKHQLAVGDGWYPIIYDMLSKLDKLQRESLVDYHVVFTFDSFQVKEKLGGLRYYYNLNVIKENLGSKRFRKFDMWVRTQMCKRGFAKTYWKLSHLRRKYIYETIYEKIDTIVSDTEYKSFKTCEACGCKGERCNPSGHWILTLCEKHFEEERKREEKRNESS